MANPTDPRGPGRVPPTPNPTTNTLHVAPAPERSGIGGLAFIVGGLLVAVVVLFFFLGGDWFDNRAAVSGSDATGSTTQPVQPVTPAQPEAVEREELLEQPIPGVQTQPTPAPVD